MRVSCPKCGSEIAGTEVNVATDVARCVKCNEVFTLSAVVHDESAAALDLTEPPRGVWYEEEPDGFLIGATTRHPMVFFLVPFLCVWSSFSLGGLYGTQIAAGRFDLFSSLVGMPFLLGTLLFGWIALMAMCGKVVVQVVGSDGVAFTGIGRLGRRQRFSWAEVAALRIERVRQPRGGDVTTIALVGRRKVSFGSSLTDERRDFLAAVLREHLKRRDQ
jgi:hypothetical protein